MSTYERLQFDVKVKILMVGDSGVGKSCILLRFADDKFQTTFITTIGETSHVHSLASALHNHVYAHSRVYLYR